MYERRRATISSSITLPPGLCLGFQIRVCWALSPRAKGSTTTFGRPAKRSRQRS
jgi:hypothetical protein